MAKHGCGRHLKRIAVPRALRISRKNAVWFKKADAGPHARAESIPLVAMLRDVLRLSGDAREAKKLLKSGSILVDGRMVREEGFPLGLMDVVSIPKAGRFYRIVLKHGVVAFTEIQKEAAEWKYCRLIGKRIVRGGKIQLVFHDGRTQIIEKEEDRFRPGDSVKLSVPKQEIAGFLKQEKNALCYVWKGKHCGEIARLSEILARTGSQSNNARLVSGDGHELVTLQDYLFVVDDAFKL